MDGRALPARLVIADDHALVREGMRAILESEPDLVVIGEAHNGQEALSMCHALSPDLVLMDVRMPKMDGLAATRALKAQSSETAVLIVTTHEDPVYLLEAIKSGAAGYVLKDATRPQLLEAIRQVLDGESPLNQNLAMQLLKRLSSVEAAPDPPEQQPAEKLPEKSSSLLTPRELDVLRSLVSGKSNREISQELHLALSTVKGHVERITAKLKVSDRTQAAVKAIEMGLVDIIHREVE